MRIEEITHCEQLHAIKNEWAALCDVCPSTTPFQTPHWLLPWWDTFGGSTLKCVVIRDCDHIVALGLFFIYTDTSDKKRKLCFLGTGISDYLTIIACPGMETKCCHLIIDYLVSISNEWDECDLQDIPEICTVLLNQKIPDTFSTNKSIWNICPYLVLPSTSILFDEHLTKKLRQNIHRAQRELVTLGNVTLEKANPGNIEFFLDSFFKLQNDRWKNRETTTVIHNTSLCSFYRTVARNFVNDHLVELYILRINNIDIASYYILHKGMSNFAYLSGFDSSFSHYSPGTVALYSIIQESIKYGIEMFDFMRGAEQYKFHWKPLTHLNYRIRILKK